jgi:hypothetical protein
MKYSYYLPFFYTYYTRLGNIRALIAYLAWDLFLPYSAIYYYSGFRSLFQVFLMFIGFISLYECGYYYNDTRSTRYEIGGDRLNNVSIKPVPFVSSRMITFLMVLILLLLDNTVNVLSYFMMTIFIVILLFVHSSQMVHKISLARLFTFTGLAFYRSAYLVEI